MTPTEIYAKEQELFNATPLVQDLRAMYEEAQRRKQNDSMEYALEVGKRLVNALKQYKGADRQVSTPFDPRKVDYLDLFQSSLKRIFPQFIVIIKDPPPIDLDDEDSFDTLGQVILKF